MQADLDCSKRYRDHRCRQPARNDSVVEDNPRRACAARVTVLGRAGPCLCTRGEHSSVL